LKRNRRCRNRGNWNELPLRLWGRSPKKHVLERGERGRDARAHRTDMRRVGHGVPNDIGVGKNLRLSVPTLCEASCASWGRGRPANHLGLPAKPPTPLQPSPLRNPRSPSSRPASTKVWAALRRKLRPRKRDRHLRHGHQGPDRDSASNPATKKKSVRLMDFIPTDAGLTLLVSGRALK
jgi:hypothetical protein